MAFDRVDPAYSRYLTPPPEPAPVKSPNEVVNPRKRRLETNGLRDLDAPEPLLKGMKLQTPARGPGPNPPCVICRKRGIGTPLRICRNSHYMHPECRKKYGFGNACPRCRYTPATRTAEAEAEAVPVANFPEIEMRDPSPSVSGVPLVHHPTHCSVKAHGRLSDRVKAQIYATGNFGLSTRFMIESTKDGLIRRLDDCLFDIRQMERSLQADIRRWRADITRFRRDLSGMESTHDLSYLDNCAIASVKEHIDRASEMIE
jgi:hypothetical protein